MFSNFVKSMLRLKVSKGVSEAGSERKIWDSSGRGGSGESGVVGDEYVGDTGD